MQLCANPKCRAVLGEYQWGAAYCSKRCMAAGLEKGDKVDDFLHDPNDPTGRAPIARTADEVDAMLEAFAIDPRLPRIIYLRKKKTTYRKIGSLLKISDCMVIKIIQKLAPKQLRECGLWTFQHRSAV